MIEKYSLVSFYKFSDFIVDTVYLMSFTFNVNLFWHPLYIQV